MFVNLCVCVFLNLNWFGWMGVVAQVRPGDARGAQDPANAQPLVQVVQGVDASEGGRRVRGGDQLGSGVVHTGGDRPARRARTPAVQQGPAGAQVHGLSEGFVPERQVHIHGARRQSHRPLDHLAPSESLMFSTHPFSGLLRNLSTLTVDFLPCNLYITILRINPAKTLPFCAKNSRTKSKYCGNNISLLNVRFYRTLVPKLDVLPILSRVGVSNMVLLVTATSVVTKLDGRFL